MYNAALPGEYLELLLPTLPTPPSSTENSGQQFIPTQKYAMPEQVRTNDYLLPKEISDTYKDHIYVSDNCVTPPSNQSAGSAPTNHCPADIIHSDLTAPAGHQNRLFTNMGWGMNELPSQDTFHNIETFNSMENSRMLSEVKPLEICEMLSLQKCSILKDIRKKRSYSESSYNSLPNKVPLSKRVSSESGYGTTTTRSSVSSEKDRLCHKCRHSSDNDDVFYTEEEEELGDQKVTSDKELTL